MGVPHKFHPEHAAHLISPSRREWLDPDRVLERWGLLPGMRVLDVGAGPGFFALPAAARVAPGGLVVACDISGDMLEMLRQRAADAAVDNLLLLHSEESRVPLWSQQVDRVLLANVLHELEHPRTLLHDLRRVLRPQGEVLVLEWHREPTPVGPPVEERIAPDAAEDLLVQAGFRVAERWDRVGPYTYGLRAAVSPDGAWAAAR